MRRPSNPVADEVPHDSVTTPIRNILNGGPHVPQPSTRVRFGDSGLKSSLSRVE